MQDPEFCVLLGPDLAGKSSAMSALRRAPHAPRGPHAPRTPRLISADDAFLAPGHALIGRLRREVVKDVAAPGRSWSPDFFAAMLQTAVVHLRDQLLDDARTPAVVDSYYYKLLAKCRLAGAGDNPMFDWWRSFPQPRRVVYLEVSPETAWRRSREGARLNRLEHYGDVPDRDAFERYQADLRKTMREEIRDLPMTVIEEHGDPARTAAEIRKVLAHELG
ncbi:dTMP kinase [Streptomyces sp. NPDC059979]|uniref:dTMP kinase n=1 Tax=Streptomyces sp. NPDC059979 TaxID=3347021 RepID=UPI0036B930B9